VACFLASKTWLSTLALAMLAGTYTTAKMHSEDASLRVYTAFALHFHGFLLIQPLLSIAFR
jgi:hypothetical protein